MNITRVNEHGESTEFMVRKKSISRERREETTPAIQPVAQYTRKEVAILAKVCVHTIARDVREGRLEEIRYNRRRLRYHAAAVQAYLAGRNEFGFK
jgi:hypothetical protein